MSKYPDAIEGEWVQPVMRDYIMICCDCSLVHRLNFRIVDGRVQLQAFRDNRRTAAIRRGKRRADHG